MTDHPPSCIVILLKPINAAHGVTFLRSALADGLPLDRRISVRIKAGWTELHRISIFLRAQCSATDLVSIHTAAFDALYAARLPLAIRAEMDAMLMIDAGCACEACRLHSRAYLAHLFRARELLGYRLATVHNVTWTLELMRRLRGSLTDGTFHSLAARTRAAFSRSGV